MKASSKYIAVSPAILLALSSCKNPADETVDATVTEAAEVSTVDGGTIYNFTDNSTIGFVGSKVTGSHEGGFKSFDGHFIVKEGSPVAGEFSIDMNSTWSDDDKLTEHLKAPDFFNVATFQQSDFVVTGFSKTSDTTYEVSGNLTLHGVTKNITFPTTVDAGDDLIKVTAEFDINRNDFGITYEGKKDDLIRKEVIIKFDLEAKPAA